MYILYFLVAIGATTLGSLTGMGGGVMIKPILDIIGGYDVKTIGLLSSVTVFSMSVVSVLQHIRKKTVIEYHMVLPLAAGGIVGGIAGQSVFDWLTKQVTNPSMVTTVQNTILAIMILIVFVYMIRKEHIPSLGLKGGVSALAVGIFLGMSASFLGIGGGPINVALLVFLFGYDTKQAAVGSLFTILFSQTSKLISVAVAGGFAGLNWNVQLVMIVGAILGGTIGANLNKKLDEKMVLKAFNAVQIFVFAMALYNVWKSIAG